MGELGGPKGFGFGWADLALKWAVPESFSLLAAFSRASSDPAASAITASALAAACRSIPAAKSAGSSAAGGTGPGGAVVPLGCADGRGVHRAVM